MYNIDVLLLTEMKLEAETKFYVPDYTLYRADHPSDSRKDGAALLIK